MNTEMRNTLSITEPTIIGSQFEDLLTVGSRIFFQTHFYPLIKMQKSAREIYLSFKGAYQSIPVLLNVEVRQTTETPDAIEIHCSGMIISNRNRFEKELIEAKKAAEVALAENAELTQVKNDLLEHQQEMESQFRKLRSLKEQQQEMFKLIAHDLQEPLRKTVFTSDFLLSGRHQIEKDVSEKLVKIIGYTTQMREMLITLQRFQELELLNLKYSPVNLTSIVNDAIVDLDIRHDSSVEITYPSISPVFSADQHLLTHFFIELIRKSLSNKVLNGEKLKIGISLFETQKNVFIESAGRYQYEQFVKITYIDNGQGFLTDSSKMFQILQKSAHFNKISIGLAFCKKIVEKHQGTIVAKAVKGSGVGYTIFFPVKRPDAFVPSGNSVADR